jgi:hypothetical protein
VNTVVRPAKSGQDGVAAAWGKSTKIKVNVGTDFDSSSLQPNSAVSTNPPVPSTTPVPSKAPHNPFSRAKTAEPKNETAAAEQKDTVSSEMSFQELLDEIDAAEREQKQNALELEKLNAEKKEAKVHIKQWVEEFEKEHKREPKGKEKDPIGFQYQQYKSTGRDVDRLKMRQKGLEDKLWQLKVNLKLAK